MSVVTIIDFDDTLFPTSFFGKLETMPVIVKSHMGAYRQLVNHFMQNIQQHSDKVYIVSNASQGWIDSASSAYLPELADIEVISAKDKYSEKYPAASWVWKKKVFEEIITKHPDIKQFISIGDGPDEFISAQQLGQELNPERGIVVKVIKYNTKPTLHDLAVQHQYIISSLQHIYSGKHNITVIIPENHHSGTTQFSAHGCCLFHGRVIN